MTKERFEELNLSKEVLDAVSDMGFEEMSPIQAQAIPYLMEGEDVIGQAQTGTGSLDESHQRHLSWHQRIREPSSRRSPPTE